MFAFHLKPSENFYELQKYVFAVMEYNGLICDACLNNVEGYKCFSNLYSTAKERSLLC